MQYLRKEALILMHCEWQQWQQFICTELFHFVVKQGTPTSDELEELGVDIGENWIQLGRRLGVSNAKLKALDQHHHQLSEKGYYMLKHWSQKNGSDATYQGLCRGLLNKLVQRRDLAEKFCYKFNGNCFSQDLKLHRYIHTYLPTYLPACLPACLHACMHTCIHTCIHTL